MTIIIFADQGGVCRSIRNRCQQPGIGGKRILDIDEIEDFAIVTAVMEVYEV